MCTIEYGCVQIDTEQYDETTQNWMKLRCNNPKKLKEMKKKKKKRRRNIIQQMQCIYKFVQSDYLNYSK